MLNNLIQAKYNVKVKQKIELKGRVEQLKCEYNTLHTSKILAPHERCNRIYERCNRTYERCNRIYERHNGMHASNSIS